MPWFPASRSSEKSTLAALYTGQPLYTPPGLDPLHASRVGSQDPHTRIRFAFRIVAEQF